MKPTVTKHELMYKGNGPEARVYTSIGNMSRPGVIEEYIDARGYNPLKSEQRKALMNSRRKTERAVLKNVPLSVQHRSKDTIARNPLQTVKQAMRSLANGEKLINSIFADLNMYP